MKKSIFTIIIFSFFINIYGQFPEGFEEDIFPPQGWITFDNGIGLGQTWQKVDSSFEGNSAAFIRYENVDSGIAEDWLVTPQFTPTADNFVFSFYQRQSYIREYGSTFSIRVSEKSQNSMSDFIIIDEQVENDILKTFSPHEIDLHEFIGHNIYVAFVMNNDDGDNWIIDEVDLLGCPAPKNLYVSNITGSGADLGWQDDYGDSWSIEIVESGTIPTGIPNYEKITNIPFTWTGGEPFTEYEFYVKSECNDNKSSRSSKPFSFITNCSNNTCNYIFEFGDTYGDDWNNAYIEIRQNGVTTGTITQTERGFGPFTHGYSMCSDMDFELVWHSGNWDQECIFKFYDPFDQLYYSFDAGNFPKDNEVFFSNFANCDIVTCRFPYDLEVLNYTSKGADFSWKEKDNATIWDIEIVNYESSPSGIPTIAGLTSTNYTWEGGNPGSYYDFYIRAACDINDKSNWTKISFATLCENTIQEFPYFESYKAELNLPLCWSTISNGEGNELWKSKTDYFSGDTIVECRHHIENQDIWLISPKFDLTQLSPNPFLSFDWKMSYYWMVDPFDKGDLNLRFSTNNGETWSEPIWSEESEIKFPTFEWKTTKLNLEQYKTETNILFAFQYKANDASTIYLDNFKIESDNTIISIEEKFINEELLIYPNPAQNNLYVRYDDFEIKALKFNIIDIMGRKVIKNQTTSYLKSDIFNIDISSLSEGIYFIELEIGDKQQYKKFIKR